MEFSRTPSGVPAALRGPEGRQLWPGQMTEGGHLGMAQQPSVSCGRVSSSHRRKATSFFNFYPFSITQSG